MTANCESRISSVAHLFLSEMRSSQASTGGNGHTAEITGKNESENGEHSVPVARTIRRTGPDGTIYSYPPPPQQLTDQSFGADPSVFPESTPDEEFNENSDHPERKLHILGVISSHLRWEGNKALSQFARMLAGQGKTVGVLKLEAWSVHLRVYFRKDNEIKNTIESTSPDEYEEDIPTEIETVSAGSGDVAARLNTLDGQLDYLLIGWGPEFSRFEERLYELVDQVCVIGAPEREKLVRSYQILKTLAQREPRIPVGVFITDVTSFAQAQTVYSRLAKTAKDFENYSLEHLGYSLADSAIVSELLARTELKERSEAWFDELEEWLATHKSEPKIDVESQAQAAEPILNESSGYDPEKKKEIKDEDVKNHIPAAISTAKSNHDLVVIETNHESKSASLAEDIGKKILPHASAAQDALIRFMNSVGVCCARFIDDAGRGTLVLVLFADGQEVMSAGSMEHYPIKTDHLIVVTDKMLGEMEKQLWMKHFSCVEIKRLMRGWLDGRDVIIIN